MPWQTDGVTSDGDKGTHGGVRHVTADPSSGAYLMGTIMVGSVSFFGVDFADLPRWETSIDSTWKAVLRELSWSVKAVKALRLWHLTRVADPVSARRHLERAIRAARMAENARERGAINLLAAGQPGTFQPGEERQLRHAAFQVLRTANQAGERLDLLWQKLQQAFDALAASGDGRSHVAVRPGVARRLLKQRLLSAAERILAHIKRRRPSQAAAPEDAPRRVSRGRAPPLLSAASL